MAKEQLLNASRDGPPLRLILRRFTNGLVTGQAGARCGCAIQLCGFKEQGVIFVILVWFAKRFNRVAEMLTLYFGSCV